MTSEPVELSDLLATREAVVADLRTGLGSDDREFPLSVFAQNPTGARRRAFMQTNCRRCVLVRAV
jgi:hypothetical protein